MVERPVKRPGETLPNRSATHGAAAKRAELTGELRCRNSPVTSVRPRLKTQPESETEDTLVDTLTAIRTSAIDLHETIEPRTAIGIKQNIPRRIA